MQLIYCLLLFVYSYFALVVIICFCGSIKITLIRFVPLEIWMTFGTRYFPVCICLIFILEGLFHTGSFGCADLLSV